MHGVKETKELLAAAGFVLRRILAASRDGLDLSDALQLALDKEVRAHILKAYDGLAQIDDELLSLDFDSAVDLTGALVDEVIDTLQMVYDDDRLETLRELLHQQLQLVVKFKDLVDGQGA